MAYDGQTPYDGYTPSFVHQPIFLEMHAPFESIDPIFAPEDGAFPGRADNSRQPSW
jgi:hypothetical protein